jgi:hypothetical protein
MGNNGQRYFSCRGKIIMEYNKEQTLKDEIKKMTEEAEKVSSKPEEKIESIETQPTTEIEVPEIEKQARALGWKSAEEREAEGKNNNHFVDAAEYIRRQPLFERIEKQKKELDELKTLTKQTLSHVAQVRKDSYEQALRDVEAKREIAVQESNVDEFRRLELQSKNLQKQMQVDPVINQQPTTIQPHVDPELVAFANRNASWYNTHNNQNANMKAAADSIDTYLYKKAQIDQGLSNEQKPHLDVKQHLAAIESEMIRLFPDKFEAKKNSGETKSVSSTVARSTTGATTSNSDGNLVAQLSPQQRQIGEQFERMSFDPKTKKPTYTLADYAKDLKQSGRLGKTTQR